jgi:tetratricopeptide (TPR) repeat protein
MKSLILILAVLFIPFTLKAGTDFNANCRNAYSDIICLKFKDAGDKIRSEKKLNPTNSIPFLLDNYMEFIQVMTSEEDPLYRSFRKNRDVRLQSLAKGDKLSPWKLYSMAEIYFQAGMVKIKFGDYISAGVELNRAYELLKENNKEFPGFIPVKLRLGLIHALLGAVPDQYSWMMDMLRLEGSIPAGLLELTQAYTNCLNDDKYSFLIPEAAFLLSYVTVNLSGNRDAMLNLISRFDQPPLLDYRRSSPMVCLAYVNILMKAGFNDKAIQAISTCERNGNRIALNYLDYLLGIASLNRLDHNAHLPFLKFLAEFRGQNYIKSAYEHLAWYYLINNDHEKYRVYMERILLRGNDIVDNDKQAMINRKKNTPPDLFLLKARLLFDGGYYDKALAQLSAFRESKEFVQPHLKLEYTYRKARVYDNWGRKNEAIDWYRETIRLGKNDPSFFAANAALHLGLIYENSGKPALAEQAFKDCLDMDFQEYHMSITMKAKAGLNRINNDSK